MLNHTVRADNIKVTHFQFNTPNMIYTIRGTIDLQGDTISIPSGCTLKFTSGGIIKNGVVIGEKTKLKASKTSHVFQNCQLLGSWDVETLYPQWFGAKPDGKTDCVSALKCITRLLQTMPYSTIEFTKGTYLISKEIHFDTPCKIYGPKATITTTVDYADRDAFRFSKSTTGKFAPNNKITDICINFKTYSVPIGFYGYNKVNMHDCTVSTYSSSTHGYPHTKFWFAINCTRLYDATFKNIHIDQPVCYKKNQFNGADGLHLMGQCHDIIADNLFGFAGDDFIALNASEMSWGDIYNIEIKNCQMGTRGKPTKNGIRMYSQTYKGCIPVYIKDISISNCFINSDNSPSIYISNSAAGVESTEVPRLIVKNVTVTDCEFIAPQYQYSCKYHPSIIRIGGVNADSIVVKNIKAETNKDSLSSFINILDNTIISNCNINDVEFAGKNKYSFVQIGDANTSDITVKEVKFENIKSDSKLNILSKGRLTQMSHLNYMLNLNGR